MGVRVLVLAMTLLLGVRGAGAEDKPWAVGVSKDQQKRALALYTEGNGYFEQDLYVDALKRFDAALEVWDHPAIRYNAALSAMHLDRTEEAFEHLTQALRFGAAPFTPDIYKEALNHEKQIGNQLGEIEITSTEPVEVRLDSKLVLDRPGAITQRVKVGTHQIVATRPGYLDYTRTVVVESRAKAVETIALKKPVVARKLVRRWSPWKPYALLIAGALVSGAGVWLYVDTQRQFDDFDTAVEAHFMANQGDPLPPETQQMEDDAKARIIPTATVLAVGGAVVVTGIALVVMNQPRPGPLAPTITPEIGSDRAGLVISGRW